MKDHAPSAERNRHDILPVLRRVLPTEGTILEIASGTGQHAVHFAPQFPNAVWQPSERRPEALASIRAWAEEAQVPNLQQPIELDVTWPVWPVGQVAAIVNINMLHIAPWSVGIALLTGAGRVLLPGSPLFYYGALVRADRETAPSNVAFDHSLRQRDASWGLRHLDDVLSMAQGCGLELAEIVDLPNNNSGLVLRRT